MYMNFEYCEGKIHVVQEGDTLYKISRTYHVPLAMLLRANPYTDVYNLQIGSEICIPVMAERPVSKPGISNQPAEVMPTPETMPAQTANPMPAILPARTANPMPETMPARTANPMPATMPAQTANPMPATMPAQTANPMPKTMPAQTVNPMPKTMPAQTANPMPKTMPAQTAPSMPVPMPKTMPAQTTKSMSTPIPVQRPARSVITMPDNNYLDMMDNMILYVVRDDDTLGSLLERFNMDLRDLLKFNNLSGICLKSGSTIRLPENNDM